MRIRPMLAPAAAAFAAAAFAMWSQMTGFAWTDYDAEAAAPVASLLGGDVGGFLTSAPAYGASLLMRSPFAFLADGLGGGEIAVYRALAIPCLAAVCVLGLVLVRLRLYEHPAAGWGLLVIVLAAGNPVALRALDIGHPEELLGAACCVGAVLAALRERTALASVLLGVALANKAWAVVAVPVVLVALPRHRLRALLGAGSVAAIFIAPFVIADATSGGGGVVALTTHTSTIFQPWQIWWPLGDLDHTVVGGDGTVKELYRYPPAWLGPITHPLIAVVAIPIAFAWRRRRAAGRATANDALLLLALVMLLRCVLDPWNTSYYHVPFLLALLAWEAVASPRPPVLTVTASVAVWASFEWIPAVAGPDVQSLAYLAWALPAAVALAGAAFGFGFIRERKGALRLAATG